MHEPQKFGILPFTCEVMIKIPRFDEVEIEIFLKDLTK